MYTKSKIKYTHSIICCVGVYVCIPSKRKKVLCVVEITHIGYAVSVLSWQKINAGSDIAGARI